MKATVLGGLLTCRDPVFAMPACLRYRRKAVVSPLLVLSNPLVFLSSVALAFLIFILPKKSPTFNSHTRLVPLPEEFGSHQCPTTRLHPLYIFLHLHKTGGNNLKRALFAFATRNNFTLYHTCHASIADSGLMGWWLHRPKSATTLDCNLDLLRQIPFRNRSAINMIVGHQHHGAHVLFPRHIPRYFTFMRHPVLRKASHFLHFESSNSSLVEYLLLRNRNYMTKRLATRTPASQLALELRERAIDAEPFAAGAALSAARTNLLRNFFFVGLHHRYAESVCILSHILNQACRYGAIDYLPVASRTDHLAVTFPLRPHRISATQTNVRARAKTAVSALPRRIREKAASVERYDMHLFQMAEKLFEQKLSEYEQCRSKPAFRSLRV